jgi:hypothetical protein
MGRAKNQQSRAEYVKKREKKREKKRSTHRPSQPASTSDRRSWQAATSEPGEIYTPGGRIKAAGGFLAGVLSRDPRRRELRNEGLRPLLFMLPLTVLCCVVVSLLVKLLQALF